MSATVLTERVSAIPLERRIGFWWWVAFIPAAVLSAVFIGSALWLFYAGIGIWGVDWPVAWGFALINYVWWIALASGGTFISSLFYLLRAEWRGSFNRMAESMTVFAAACAGFFPIFHLGRPWFFYWLFPYPDTMGLWPQFRSPLLWDFFAILTYVLTSILFWYYGLLPDLATLRDRAPSRGQYVFYATLAMGFRGSSAQWRRYRAIYGTIAAIMAPLVVSVHSIVGLDFAGGLLPGWHSTQFPPFFVFGAVFSGFALVILLALPLRHYLQLQEFIPERHIGKLAIFTAATSLMVGYSYMMDAFMTFYGGEAAEKVQFIERVTGSYAHVYWLTIVLNVLLPQLLWFFRVRHDHLKLAGIAIGVIVGMWFERYSIVILSLHRDFLPSAWGDFHGTIWDYAELYGSIGVFLTGYLIVVRLFPIIAMFEARERKS